MACCLAVRPLETPASNVVTYSEWVTHSALTLGKRVPAAASCRFPHVCAGILVDPEDDSTTRGQRRQGFGLGVDSAVGKLSYPPTDAMAQVEIDTTDR
jgi:hypothetical protein